MKTLRSEYPSGEDCTVIYITQEDEVDEVDEVK
jgi:hypothetical protein